MPTSARPIVIPYRTQRHRTTDDQLYGHISNTVVPSTLAAALSHRPWTAWDAALVRMRSCGKVWNEIRQSMHPRYAAGCFVRCAYLENYMEDRRSTFSDNKSAADACNETQVELLQ
ncbi:predicted protein [Aspergillus terreus NIH2624]|uniref:Uncharacterized protein n=1 Tax=Aspergillus terreus (strain NIH 2624 / FGSC A1156) TaxID=341663 RepID=Q0C8R7_ASPTN|nr:uncharacterized protein ATEG_09917 [Aspergillus terreus NIH2624]EAU30108.1 predicted protein [Aspergillus terreus NIH2624]